jgi:hypothetical protein
MGHPLPFRRLASGKWSSGTRLRGGRIYNRDRGILPLT